MNNRLPNQLCRAAGTLGRLSGLAALAAASLPANGQSLPIPTIFEPGVISGPSNDGAPTFSPDGRTLLFDQSNASWATILISHLVDGHWSTPELAPFAGPSSDQQPAMSPDGRYVVYASSRVHPAGPEPGAKPQLITNLWRVDRTASGWSEPMRLPDTVNLSRRVFKPSIAANNDIYFMADPGLGVGPPNWRLFKSAYQAGAYAPPQPLPFSEGTFSDVDPFIAPDQSYIVFGSKGRRRPTDDGHEHLYVAMRVRDGWGPVKPIRYEGDDRGYDDGEPQVGPDGSALYFTSGRPVAISRSRSRDDTGRDLARLQAWDNGNNNVWTLPIRPFVQG